MAFASIEGPKLEVTVVGCNQLKDTWYGRQEAYVAILYGTTCYHTKTAQDGDNNPLFNEKFEFSLVEGQLELSVYACNSHNLVDRFIGLGKVNLENVLRKGYITTLVPLQSSTGSEAGEVRLLLQYYPYVNAQLQQGAISNIYGQPNFMSPGSLLYPPQYGAQESALYPPSCGVLPISMPQGLPIYPPHIGAQPSSALHESTLYPPQHIVQLPYISQELPYPPQYMARPPPKATPQGSLYPPQYGEQPSFLPQESPVYPPEHNAQASQYSPIYPPEHSVQALPESSPPSCLQHQDSTDPEPKPQPHASTAHTEQELRDLPNMKIRMLMQQIE